MDSESEQGWARAARGHAPLSGDRSCRLSLERVVKGTTTLVSLMKRQALLVNGKPFIVHGSSWWVKYCKSLGVMQEPVESIKTPMTFAGPALSVDGPRGTDAPRAARRKWNPTKRTRIPSALPYSLPFRAFESVLAEHGGLRYVFKFNFEKNFILSGDLGHPVNYEIPPGSAGRVGAKTNPRPRTVLSKVLKAQLPLRKGERRGGRRKPRAGRGSGGGPQPRC